MSFLEHPVQIKKEEHSLTTSQKMLLYMWASYINHKIRLGKFSQVDYNHDLTKFSVGLLCLRIQTKRAMRTTV